MKNEILLNWLDGEGAILEGYQKQLENTKKDTLESRSAIEVLQSLTNWYEMGLNNPFYQMKRRMFPLNEMKKELLKDISYGVREINKNEQQFVVKDVVFEINPENWSIVISHLKPSFEIPIKPMKNVKIIQEYEAFQAYKNKEISAKEASRRLVLNHYFRGERTRPNHLQILLKLLSFRFALHSRVRKAEVQAFWALEEKMYAIAMEKYHALEKSNREKVIEVIEQMEKSGLTRLLEEIEKKTGYHVIYESFCNWSAYSGTKSVSKLHEELIQENAA